MSGPTGEPRASLTALVADLADERRRLDALTEINDLLLRLEPADFAEAVAVRPPGELSPYLANHLAAMVDYAAARKGMAPPGWLLGIEPLQEPRFVPDHPDLRLRLLQVSPVVFRRRNIFVDPEAGRQA